MSSTLNPNGLRVHRQGLECQRDPGTLRNPRTILGPRSLKRRGTSILEFAIVAPVFFMIILGIIELGRGFMVVEQLTRAANQGARTASLFGATSTDIKNAVDSMMKGMGLKDSSGNSLGTIKVYDSGTLVYDSTKTYALPVPMTPKDQIKVEVYVPINKATWVGGGLVFNNSNAGSLKGSATLIAE